MNLFDLAAEARQLRERLSDLDLDEQTVLDTLEGETADLQTRATNIVAIASELAGYADLIRERERAMAERRKALEARADRLKRYVRDAMVFAGVTKIESPSFRLSLRAGAPVVTVYDAHQVPADFLRHPEPEIDKRSIAERLKAGEDVPGCRLDVGAPSLLVK